MLYRYYSDHNNEAAAVNLRNMSLRIARAGNREQEVSSFFIDPQAVKPGNIAVKSIEKSMKKVGDKLWASEVETTNEQYERFLTDLLKNKDYDQIMRCKSLKTNWRDLLPDSSKTFTDARLYRHGHPDDGNMPVQQITHEAAQLYCAWLTASYNISPDKKKFKKVVFRLPTEQEWMAAARAGRENTPYPWGGYYYRNSKGCYLLNLNATEPCPDCETKGIANDGGYFTVPAETYFPNDFGLFNMSGNVAEMIQEPGKAKGGSWKDDGYHTQINPVTTYTSPSPTLGFRVFMEVIEE
jgi:formylglycine-generating enzyme required for sulfatase activity